MKLRLVPYSDPGVHEMIRNHFAQEDGIDQKEAHRRYPDHRLQMVEEIDPTLFKTWAHKAATLLEQSIPA